MKTPLEQKKTLPQNLFFAACAQKALALIKLACEQKNICNLENNSLKIILGLSGGPDSVFLLHVLSYLQKYTQEKQSQKLLLDTQEKQVKKPEQATKIKIIAVHLDHQWRTESWQDVEFCNQLCKNLKIKFIARKARDLNLDIKFNGSKEELGRKMRRALFTQILKEKNAHFIALAHHLQDQQETFFLRLMRGSSLRGLCCMQEIDGVYLRPLLEVNKKDILEYLDSNNIKYLIDPTNVSQDYLRNRIRANIIPALEKCDARFNQKFQSTLKQLKQEDDFLNTFSKRAFSDIFEKNNTEKLVPSGSSHWKGDLKKLKALDNVLARRVLLHWLIQEKAKFNLSTKYLDEIIRFLYSNRGGHHTISPKFKIYKKANSFWLEF